MEGDLGNYLTEMRFGLCVKLQPSSGLTCLGDTLRKSLY